MFEFSSSTRGMDAPRIVRIIRTPKGGRLSAIILSDECLCHAVHWCGERTLPHTSKRPCAWCHAENPIKIEVYLAIWIPATDMVRILTLTDHAAQPILFDQERNGPLRGKVLNCFRPTATATGKITAAVYPPVDMSKLAPPCPDVVKHLSNIWETNMVQVLSDQMKCPSGENLKNLRR